MMTLNFSVRWIKFTRLESIFEAALRACKLKEKENSNRLFILYDVENYISVKVLSSILVF